MMKNLWAVVLALPLMVAFSTTALSQDDSSVDVEDVTMDVVENVRSFRAGGRREVRRLIADFMLENGDVTQAELDDMAANRRVIREELQALRDSGDQDALTARLSELRETRAARREEIRDYVDNNEELAAIIEARRDAFRERRAERRRAANQ